MTCREKLKMEHPEKIDDTCNGGCWGCPDSHGYLERPEDCTDFNGDCRACWDREIPGTENISTENKEEKKVAVVASNIKKTKAELQEEINALQKEIKNLERYKAYEDMADEMGAMRQAFINSGFSSEEAFTMVIETMKAGMAIAFKH